MTSMHFHSTLVDGIPASDKLTDRVDGCVGKDCEREREKAV